MTDSAPLDVASVRKHFPILDTHVNDRPLVYLDNAATTQKPLAVLDASRNYYLAVNSNIHRGAHCLARKATTAHEEARQTVARHLNAADPSEVIFTSGTTDSLNLVANILPVRKGEEILISALEHHSNIVPWQMLCERTGAVLKVIPCDDAGVLDLDAFHSLLSPQTRVLAVAWVSNAFGTVHPLRAMIDAAKRCGAHTVVDAAQAAPHLDMDVQALGADFLAFSGHKIYAPTGIGVLWGRLDLLGTLPPWRGGGEMIKEVTFERTTYNTPPFRYEAGTPNIEGAIALGAAMNFVQQLGFAKIQEHEKSLIRQAAEALSGIDGLHLYGPADRVGALSFTIDGIHHYDLGMLMDQMGVAVRTGHHCCQPLMARFGITGTIRASFAMYNTTEEVEALAESVRRAVKMLR